MGMGKEKIEKLFLHDIDQKELITKISALCGVRTDIIKQVWMYTFFNSYISLLEQRDKHFAEIKIPYFGKVMIRFKEDGGKFDQFISIDPHVEEIINNLRKGNDTGMVQFFKDNFVNKAIDFIADEDN